MFLLVPDGASNELRRISSYFIADVSETDVYVLGRRLATDTDILKSRADSVNLVVPTSSSVVAKNSSIVLLMCRGGQSLVVPSAGYRLTSPSSPRLVDSIALALGKDGVAGKSNQGRIDVDCCVDGVKERSAPTLSKALLDHLSDGMDFEQTVGSKVEVSGFLSSNFNCVFMIHDDWLCCSGSHS